jgi:hypothetical protein
VRIDIGVVDAGPVEATFVADTSGKFQVKAVGSDPAPAFTETAAFPAGVTLSSSGALSGTPQQAGSYKIELTAANRAGTGKQAFTLTVAG